MAFQFQAPINNVWHEGCLYLGGYYWPEEAHHIGLMTERHAITIAGSRSGKGAAQIIPNLLVWDDNVLVIDPKGENAAATVQARRNLGQITAVLDPFHVANVPDDLRVSVNLLDHLDPNSRTIREDILAVADGLVMRYKADDAMWDNGSVSFLGGLIAHVVSTAPPERRNLADMRRLLLLPEEDFAEVLHDMSNNPSCGRLAQNAAVIGLSDSKKNREYVAGARDNTEWLDSEPMVEALGSTGRFQMSMLKRDAASLYLVLPPEELVNHGRFLRLFVNCALRVMMKGGDLSVKGNRRCLFILDEFFSLGHLPQIAKASGLMAGYGLQLWPFLQDLGQLVTLYGKEGAETFFGNADAHIFFGNTDPFTLGHISERLGRLTPDEVAEVVERGWTAPQHGLDRDYENAKAHYQHRMARVGQPRMTPEEVKAYVGKLDGMVVAGGMIVFAKGGEVWGLGVEPYFCKWIDEANNAHAQRATVQKKQADVVGMFLGRIILTAAIVGILVGVIWSLRRFDLISWGAHSGLRAAVLIGGGGAGLLWSLVGAVRATEGTKAPTTG